MKKVLLGMSGGVDSSVSAVILQKQGYEVVGATMILCGDESSTSIEDAKKVCKKLKIEHHVIDLRKEFKKNVIDNFICSYICARTPNPCVECNKTMKFGEFYKVAQDLDCEYIATGHYAKIIYSEEYGQYVLTKSNTDKKDQSYFLYGINSEILPHVIFPLAEFEDKTEIRKIAEENGLEVAKKKDSQEICFVPNNDYISFLKYNLENNANICYLKEDKHIAEKKGKIVLKDGKVLGEHTGLINYTVGQRKGLGISYKEPLYVIALNKERNQVIVGAEEELYSSELEANELNFLVNIDLTKPIEIKAKIRYRSKEADSILKVENGIAKVAFKEPQRAITPGQSVVFYKDDIVIGGGKITGKG